MKKLSFFAVAIAAMCFTACGGNKSAQSAESAEVEKTFEQEQVEEKIKIEIDSLANELGKLKQLPIVLDDNGIKLTDQEKQVKPEYLIDPAVAENAETLAEKYRLVSALSVDAEVAALYDMDTKAYDEAIAKLVADINDPSFSVIEENADIFKTTEALYNAMNENGRINFFWQLAATTLVEELYVITQNSEKFLAAFDDESASNVTFRIVLITDAISRLAEYDTDLAPVAEAIEPLKILNAISVEQLKAQLAEASESILNAHNALVK